MLRRLKTTVGLSCNYHTFRRTFACLLRKAGLDILTKKRPRELGKGIRWGDLLRVVLPILGVGIITQNEANQRLGTGAFIRKQ